MTPKVRCSAARRARWKSRFNPRRAAVIGRKPQMLITGQGDWRMIA
jgi:hypothetical protein